MIEPRQRERWERQIDAMLREAGRDDPETFAVIVRLFESALARLPEAAAQLRQPNPHGVRGYSWAEIAAPLHVTRVSAFKRFRTKEA